MSTEPNDGLQNSDRQSRMSTDRESHRSLAGDEYYTDERCHILELFNSSDFPDASIARARVEPGITTKRHRVAGTVERYIIMEGSGLARVEDSDARAVVPGDVIVIPAGATQSIINTGDHDLVFLCVCTPRFEWDNYESLE